MQEDIQHKQYNSYIVIPLYGLNVDAIYEWYTTVDGNDDQWTKNNRAVATALTKGSDYFEDYFTGHTNKDSKNDIYYAVKNYRLNWL